MDSTPSDDGRVILRLRDVSVEIETASGVIRPVDGVSLDVRAGRTLGVVGESGSGKSLLMRAIMGLLPPHAEVRGLVEYKAVDLTTLSDAQRRRLWSQHMSVVFQDPMTSLDPLQRVEKQIAESLIVHTDLSRSERRRKIDELLAALGIPDTERCRRSYPHQLSGGMRQRVCIAIALVCEPGLVLADEPTTALDVTVQAQIIRLLRDQQRLHERSMIFVSHDLGVISDIADDLAVMYAGQVVEHGSVSDVLAHPRMRYTAGLLASRPTLTGDRRSRLGAIGGRPPSPHDLPSGCRFAPRCSCADARCATAPALATIPPDDRLVRCWYPVELDTP